MSRWEPNARDRLERAALELFDEQGFAETTVPQITARAGLTTRTFFRHFSDKREVLFGGEVDVPSLAARMITEAPAFLTPLQIIAGGFDAVAAAQFTGGMERFVARKKIIEQDAGLRERELQKQAALSDAIQQSFRDRGVDDLTAALVAHTTVTVFSVSIGRWMSLGGETPLPDLLRETLDSLRSIMVEPVWP
ncbi:TetR/AcrR family transcriptional regulator [Subtercola boreus]|uniref:TetR family transcriptional regulator n=1 Tax=Subtercola boreus TaxID=120213 RepID=A0A3E0WAJ6_9MICO|nr:TetR/AcrR family transcriptional regulator [Subtercola boreus]RFA18993.1 TetR family transcriptional regulator [Subtercola boreus]RFA19120.1 TetR family transcriptional regulator [Subtercola boreus]RFA25719.1 TetR family transcriptional regulator [Subtercola boreus]